MNCPVNKTTELKITELDQNLSSLNCPDCGGNWIRGAEYWKWVEHPAIVHHFLSILRGLIRQARAWANLRFTSLLPNGIT